MDTPMKPTFRYDKNFYASVVFAALMIALWIFWVCLCAAAEPKANIVPAIKAAWQLGSDRRGFCEHQFRFELSDTIREAKIANCMEEEWKITEKMLRRVENEPK